MTVDDRQVAAAMVSVADRLIVPKFRALADGEVFEKGAGEWVTTVDHDVEHMLGQLLAEIAPGVPVLGEEAASAEPALAARLLSLPRVWLLDPLDGTKAFIGGSPDVALMVALVEAGQTMASWIWQPIHRRMFMAQRGAGATVADEPLRRATTPTSADQLCGEVKTSFLDETTRSRVRRGMRRLPGASVDGPAAGIVYPKLAEGSLHFALFWRLLPWDHSPGVLLATEAGCHAARVDGSRYRPDLSGDGLLVASDERTWHFVRSCLLGPE